MEQSSKSTKYKRKIALNIPLSQPIRTTVNIRKLYKKCNQCNRRRIDENHQICHVCYKTRIIIKPQQSGNTVIDDFITYTQTNCSYRNLKFVPYDQFKIIEFIAEGGFSKVYKATWVGGSTDWHTSNIDNIVRRRDETVVLKKLKNSKNITSKELNELKIFYKLSSILYIGEYFGITQDYVTKDLIMIMPYYDCGDLSTCLKNDYYKICWKKSSDIELVKNNPGAIYKSRPLSNMIYSAMSLKSRSINLELDTRKFEESLVVKDNNNNDYLTKEFELDI
ncbi:uncharacterized protein OCT59_021012 [Rhizophagus irregularis]|uniref:uncharacterized protein n=1 Tax=Rhizophagus irregularis TaxID=588596 RepID=UPI003318EA44|nr:hypothetical protein OCT59_021012 [Rhizophagus irregularis]